MSAGRRTRFRWLKGTALAILHLALAAAFLAPVLFLVAAGFKPDSRVLAEGSSWKAFVPVDPTLDNYHSVFEQLDFTRFLLNSLLIVGSIVIAGLLVNSMAGYALARLKWRGRRVVLAGILATLIIPYEAVAVPLFLEMTLIGWTQSYHVQIVPFIANPFSIYLFYTFFRGLPESLDEAARLDGAGPWRIYFAIVLPLSRPVLAAVAILTFLVHWGFFLWPLMVTRGPTYQPLTVALGYYSANKPVQWGDIAAFGTLLVAPVLVIFLAFQRWFVRAIAMTGVRG